MIVDEIQETDFTSITTTDAERPGFTTTAEVIASMRGSPFDPVFRLRMSLGERALASRSPAPQAWTVMGAQLIPLEGSPQLECEHHAGVYFPFLAEAAEFSRVALDALRQPLESGSIEVHRAGFTARFPARFQLVLAMNPCPCGNHGVRGAECVCPPMAIRRYATRLSGPLRDRVDIDLPVARVATHRAVEGGGSPLLTSAEARERVNAARARASDRWMATPWRRNAEVPGTWLRQGALRLGPTVRAPLDRALERGALTLRGYDRVLRLAWTMADITGRDTPGLDEVGRALHLRRGMTP